MKIVVTGALGHIGSHLIRKLGESFDHPEIVMTDDMSTQRYCSLFNLPKNATYRFQEGKLQTADIDSLISGAAAVIHLSAITDAAGTADKPDAVYQNNFGGTKAVAEACMKAGVPFLFPSTTSVYGSQSTLVDEDCQELQPQSPYADTKIKEENLVRELTKNGLKGVICRFGTIYGISEGMRFHTAVNKFCWQAVLGQEITVWETALDQKRPYLDLNDCVRAVAWIVKKNLFDGKTYNIVSGNHTVRNVVDEIKKTIPDAKIKFVQHKIMNQLSYEVSSERFKAQGFEFQGKLSSGISDTMKLLGPVIVKKS